MKLNILVCDDEPIICDAICAAIQKIRPNDIITSTYSGEELIAQDKYYDIIFLDIEMNGISGMECATRLRESGCNSYIIFLTSHTECMPDAFKVKAFRFMEKPLNNTVLEEALTSIEKELLNKRKIMITVGQDIIPIDVGDIICLEAFGDGTYIYTQNQIFVTAKQLKYYIDILGSDDFYHIHRSFAISFKYIKSIMPNEVNMYHMKSPIPISRRKFADFKQCYKKYIRMNAICL